MKKRAKYISLLIAFSLILSLTVMPQTSSSIDLEGIDLAFINGGSDGYVYGDLDLKEQDELGNDITWTAEDDSILDAETGKILRYMTNGVISTSVTATVNGESEEIPFKIKYINNKTVSDNLLHQEDFDDYTTGNIAEIIGEDTEDTLNDLAYSGGILETNPDKAANYSSGISYLEICEEGTDDKALQMGAGEVTQHMYYYSRDCDFSNAGDNLLIKMQLKIEDGGSIYVPLGDGSYNNAKVFLRIKDGSVIVGNGAKTAQKTISDADYVDGEYHTVTYLLDKGAGANGTFSLWIDNRLLAENIECYTSITGGFPNAIGFRCGDTDTVAYVDDIEVYKAVEPMKDIDLYLINGDNSNSVTGNLYLPTETENGEIISWESDNGNIVISGEEGIVEIGDTQKEGAVTAAVEINGITYVKRFELVIPKYEKTYSSLPTPVLDEDGKEIVVYEENFDDTTIEKLLEDGHLDGAQVDNGEMSVEDGKFVITKDGAQAHHHYSIADAVAQIDDRLVIEFEATRSSTNGFLCLFTSANLLSSAKVHTVFNDQVQIATSENTTPYAVKDSYTKVNRASKIVMLVCKDSTFSLWVDGERLVNREKTRNDTSGWATKINFRNNPNMGTLKIDNLRIFKAAVSQVEMAEDILKSIEDAEDIIKRDDNGDIASFEYTGSNEHGCSVEFSSENDLTDADGTIKFPLQNTQDEITVTVTSPEGYTDSKTFSVEIPANYILGDVRHKISTLGLQAGENEFIIPAESRGNEPLGGVSIKVEVLNSGGGSVVSDTLSGQNLSGDADYFLGAIDLDAGQIPENYKVKVSLYATETEELLQNGEFEIVGG